MEPEEAVESARQRAAEARARGEYTQDLSGFGVAPTDRVSVEQLMEWAVVEPDLAHMRSTRRFGAPITLAKRLLLRGLQQYFNELTMLQARFNLHLLVRMTELEDRVIALEDEAARRRGDTTTDAAPGALRPGPSTGAVDSVARPPVPRADGGVADAPDAS